MNLKKDKPQLRSWWFLAAKKILFLGNTHIQILLLLTTHCRHNNIWSNTKYKYTHTHQHINSSSKAATQKDLQVFGVLQGCFRWCRCDVLHMYYIILCKDKSDRCMFVSVRPLMIYGRHEILVSVLKPSSFAITVCC